MLRRDRMLLTETMRAAPDDSPAVRDLLTDAGLPIDGAAEAFSSGIVARDGDRVVGSWIGTAVVHAAEGVAAERGAAEVILLTESATTWFARCGYEVIDLSEVPADVATSIEFETACSSTAVAMRRTLQHVEHRDVPIVRRSA